MRFPAVVLRERRISIRTFTKCFWTPVYDHLRSENDALPIKNTMTIAIEWHFFVIINHHFVLDDVHVDGTLLFMMRANICIKVPPEMQKVALCGVSRSKTRSEGPFLYNKPETSSNQKHFGFQSHKQWLIRTSQCTMRRVQ